MRSRGDGTSKVFPVCSGGDRPLVANLVEVPAKPKLALRHFLAFLTRGSASPIVSHVSLLEGVEAIPFC